MASHRDQYLVHCFFLLYINDLPKTINVNAEIFLYADDTTVIIISLNPINFKSSVNKVFQDINRWFATNALSLSVYKTLSIMHGNKKIVNICNPKFLGLTLDNTCSWKTHIGTAVLKLSSACFMIITVKPVLSPETLKMVSCSYFHSTMTYGLIFWGNSCYSNIIFRVQKRIIRIMMGIRDRDSCKGKR
jgi:hypothetical protein